jgi:anaerobic selenocysteine-containing dehydrogenase
LSRRQFLKATAGGAGLTLLSPLNGTQSQASDNEHVEIETSHSICNFCSSLCNLKVTTENRGGRKRIVKLAGNPHSTLNRGKLCARGQSGLRQVYDPDRIKTPLIRAEGSKRGEYAFRSASWEEAWDYIAQKKANADLKPWEWTMVGGWTSCVFYMNWAIPFAMSNGVPNIIASPMQHCVTTGHLGTDAVTGNFNIHDEILPDFDNARYILFIANNSSIGAVSTCRMVRFAQGRKNGAKVVALDPRRSETAAKADEWIAIRPGTDLAFLLAMMHIMMEEGYYDATFLKRHTNMPFLLYKDEAGEWQPLTDDEGRPKVVAEGTRDVVTLKKFSNDNRNNIEGRVFCPELLPPVDLLVDGKPVKSVWIHPQRAGALGIAQGDKIRLTNNTSKQTTEGRAYVTRLIRPDTLFIYSSFGVENPALSQTQGEGTATNKLIPYQVEPVVAGFKSQEFTLRVAKA